MFFLWSDLGNLFTYSVETARLVSSVFQNVVGVSGATTIIKEECRGGKESEAHPPL